MNDLYRRGDVFDGDIELWIELGRLIPVEPVTVICKHNTPEALTTSLFLAPVPRHEAIPEGTYALVRVGDREETEDE